MNVCESCGVQKQKELCFCKVELKMMSLSLKLQYLRYELTQWGRAAYSLNSRTPMPSKLVNMEKWRGPSTEPCGTPIMLL